MKNKDLSLIHKATDINRQTFKDALATQGATKVIRSMREALGIPDSGLADDQVAQRWYNPTHLTFDELVARQQAVRTCVRDLRAMLRLSDNFEAAIRHYLLRDDVGHIPGNFVVSIHPGSTTIDTREYQPLKTGEKTFLNILKGAIYDAFDLKAIRIRKNADRDRRITQLSTTKTLDSSTRTDASIVAEIYPDDDESIDISSKADKRRIQTIRQAKQRARGRKR